MSPIFASILFDDKGSVWKEDFDNDGYFETITENHLPGGRLVRTITEEDGTMYQTEYDAHGNVNHEWMIVSPGEEGENPTIYVWDEETMQWRPDQNQDGMPDLPLVESDDSNQDNTGRAGSVSGGAGGSGGGNKVL